MYLLPDNNNSNQISTLQFIKVDLIIIKRGRTFLNNNVKDYFYFITNFNEKHYLQHYEIKKNWITYDMGIIRPQIRNL